MSKCTFPSIPILVFPPILAVIPLIVIPKITLSIKVPSFTCPLD